MNKGSVDNQAYKRDKRFISFVLLACSLLVFFTFVVRLYYMQFVEKNTYQKISKTISTRRIPIYAQRGEIYDRNNNNAMVVNSDSFIVEITPGNIPVGYYDTVASKLSRILGIPKSNIDEIIPPEVRRDFTSYTIKKNVTFDTVSNIAENITDLPGVTWQIRPMRNYIETGSFSHILGYVQKIQQNQFYEKYNQGGYNINTIVGQAGIEMQYDSYLQGKDGYEERVVDVKGRILSETPTIVPPQMGKKLVLTIDSRIQTLAEKALGDRVGSIIVLKPDTGEVLAMVSYPYYDSNLFNSENASEEFEKIKRSEFKPMLNRAVDAAYPPASTFKVIMETAILQEHAFPEFERIECKGEIEYGGRSFHCWVEKPGHGKLDLKHALGYSCDIYFWQVGRENLGIQKISDYAKMFGYGQYTQIDLPSQQKGFVAVPEWKERKYHTRWMDGDTMNVSIGQGYTTATPLHVANVMAMVCNEGKIYKPHLLKEIRDSVTDEVIQEVHPEILYENSIDRNVWRKVKESCRFVCTDGSAHISLQNPVVKIAAKTGTAEVTGYKDSWHSWLLAYAPYDAPVEDQIVVCTMIEACNDWESWAATHATNVVIQGYFANQTFEEAVDALNFRWAFKSTRRTE